MKKVYENSNSRLYGILYSGDSCFDSLFLFRRRKGKKLAKFYTVQNSRIDNLLEPTRAHTSDSSQEKANTALRVGIVIHASFIATAVWLFYSYMYP